MGFGLDDFLALARDTVMRPAQAVPRILALAPPPEQRWMAGVAVVALSSILAWLASILFPLPVETPWSPITRSPMVMAVVQLVVLLLVSGLVAGVGRMFGGRGQFADALWLLIWIDAIMLAIQLVQVVLMFVFPLTAEMLGLAVIGLFFWLVIALTKELHGFQNLGLVALGVVATLLLTGLLLSVTFGALGLLPPMEALPQ